MHSHIYVHAVTGRRIVLQKIQNTYDRLLKNENAGQPNRSQSIDVQCEWGSAMFSSHDTMHVYGW